MIKTPAIKTALHQHETISDSYVAGSVCSCGAVKHKPDRHGRVVHSIHLSTNPDDGEMIWPGQMPLVPATRYDVHRADGTHLMSLTHRKAHALGNPGEGRGGTIYEILEAHKSDPVVLGSSSLN